MKRERSDEGAEIECNNAVRDHAGRFKRLVSPRNAIDRAIREMAADDKPATLVALFDGRASYHTIRSWRRGQAGMPQWAIDLLRAKHDARGAMLSTLVAGPGRSAGWRNVKGYQLNMRR